MIHSSEPPLNEEDVPPGEWHCPRCRAIQEIEKILVQRTRPRYAYQDETSISARNSKINQIETVESARKIRILMKLHEKKNPFSDLVRISLLLNPKEYELPDDYIPNIQFPGSSKKQTINSSSREARLSSYSVRRAQELDRDNLPLILRTCYFCRKGWRKAPLINCDYCPLNYHADCIDPPLTNLPTTRWMCPNHVEPIAEEKLLNSSSYSERIRLWNRFSQPIDHESVKSSFLDKILGRASSYSDRLSPEEGTQETESIVDMPGGGTDALDGQDELHDSRLREALKQMIESSRILDVLDEGSSRKTEDMHQSSASNIPDRDAKEKNDWVEFLIKLANSGLNNGDYIKPSNSIEQEHEQCRGPLKDRVQRSSCEPWRTPTGNSKCHEGHPMLN